MKYLYELSWDLENLSWKNQKKVFEFDFLENVGTLCKVIGKGAYDLKLYAYTILILEFMLTCFIVNSLC